MQRLPCPFDPLVDVLRVLHHFEGQEVGNHIESSKGELSSSVNSENSGQIVESKDHDDDQLRGVKEALVFQHWLLPKLGGLSHARMTLQHI